MISEKSAAKKSYSTTKQHATETTPSQVSSDTTSTHNSSETTVTPNEASETTGEPPNESKHPHELEVASLEKRLGNIMSTSFGFLK